ncbi:hypothetical protein HNR23_002264 [Nocardiopsis mwathae]|uniref:DUF3560 domain-containing protein n=1 Tax=Nocardiopsis mwathae TaxID=1472723 RepID=A0A7X0D6K0_9ACTN|nr:hypothetical protein [Nocardiopsis mwathae]
MITIRHTRADGTIADGTARGDGTDQHLKAAGFWFSRNLPDGPGWYVPRSRDKAASWRVDDAARRLRDAGFAVTVEVDNATPGRAFADAEAENSERAEARAERAATYRSRAAEKSAAARSRFEEMAEGWPIGQPLISDRARSFHKKMMATDDRAHREAGKASYWDGKQAAAEQGRRFRESVPATLRRIERLEERERRLLRDFQYTETCASWRADLAQLRDELAYWRDHVAQAEAAGVKVWRPEDFTKGDYVKVWGQWVPVLRVNKKSLSIPWAHLWITGSRVYTWEEAHANPRGRKANGRLITDTLPYDRVRGRASAEEIEQVVRGD